MASNLPPGVTVNMLPGNRPEDEYMDSVLEFIAVDVSELPSALEKSVMDIIADGWNHRDKLSTTVERVDTFLKGADL